MDGDREFSVLDGYVRSDGSTVPSASTASRATGHHQIRSLECVRVLTQFVVPPTLFAFAAKREAGLDSLVRCGKLPLLLPPKSTFRRCGRNVAIGGMCFPKALPPV